MAAIHSYRVVQDYYRREHFDFYRSYPSPFWGATVAFDVTAVKRLTERRGYSTYATLCYFFTRAARRIDDFRYRYRANEGIVLYDELHPGLTVPAPDRRFSFSYLEYLDDFDRFSRQARDAMRRSGSEVRLCQSEHSNYIFFTALPQVSFTGFHHAFDGPTDACPRVAFGRFLETDGRITVPVGIQVNHLFIDGGALGELCAVVERLYANPEGASDE